MEKDVKSIGRERLEFLDAAFNSLGQGNMDATVRYVDVFLSTIKDGHASAQEIQKEFDVAMQKKNKTLAQLQKDTEKLGIWERADAMANGKTYIEMQEINDRLNILWQTSLKHGLFNE